VRSLITFSLQFDSRIRRRSVARRQTFRRYLAHRRHFFLGIERGVFRRNEGAGVLVKGINQGIKFLYQFRFLDGKVLGFADVGLMFIILFSCS